MYAETWPFFSYLQSFSLHELPHCIPKIDARGNIVQMPTLSEYDLGGEGDLFKAPKPIIEEPGVGFDTMTTTISMLSGGKDISTDTIQVTDIESMDSKQLSERGLVPASSVLEYDLGGGDLFKAPETVIEEPALGFDAITTTVSMIPVCEDVISVQAIEAADIESIQREHLLNEVFYECKKDLLEKSALDGSFSEVSDVKIPVMLMEDTTTAREKLVMSGPIHKSLSSESLSSMEWIGAGAAGTRFLDFAAMDLRAAFGMRRAFSESDIKTLGDQKTSHVHSHSEQILTISNCPIEDRWQKLSRYRKKKTKRNFDRKIKYACRKALADSQPRIRGRFAKTG